MRSLFLQLVQLGAVDPLNAASCTGRAEPPVVSNPHPHSPNRPPGIDGLKAQMVSYLGVDRATTLMMAPGRGSGDWTVFGCLCCCSGLPWSWHCLTAHPEALFKIVSGSCCCQCFWASHLATDSFSLPLPASGSRLAADTLSLSQF